VKKPSILVVGSDSRIGSFLLNNLPSNGFSTVGTTRRSSFSKLHNVIYLDLCDQFYSFVTDPFDVAVICGGLTDIGFCQAHPELVNAVNVVGTKRLIDFLKSRGCKILFISSNAVFDGTEPFVDHQTKTNPQTKYGQSKVDVEKYLLNHNSNDSILRLTKVVEPSAGFIRRWETLVTGNKAVPIYTNHLVSPISLHEILQAILEIIRCQANGIYQLGGKIELSYFDFALDYFRDRPSAIKLLQPEIDLNVEKKFNSLKTFLPKVEC